MLIYYSKPQFITNIFIVIDFDIILKCRAFLTLQSIDFTLKLNNNFDPIFIILKTSKYQYSYSKWYTIGSCQ